MTRLARIALLAVLACLPWPLPPVGAGEPPAQPEVRITTPRGGQTSDRTVDIAGTVTGFDGDRLTLVLNGVPLSIAREGETFKSTQVLAPGWNTIRVRAAEGRQHAEDEVALYARVPRKDLRIAMTWNTPGTDIDLWVTGPDGEKVFYSNKQGKAGGVLDVDVTSGFGPETFTQARAQRGTYRVQAHYYGSGPPTRVRIVVLHGEGTPRESRHRFQGILVRQGEVLEAGTFVVP